MSCRPRGATKLLRAYSNQLMTLLHTLKLSKLLQSIVLLLSCSMEEEKVEALEKAMELFFQHILSS